MVHAWNQSCQARMSAGRVSMALHKTYYIQRQIYQQRKWEVQKLISSAKTKHFNNCILDFSSANVLQSTMNEPMGTAKSPALTASYSTVDQPSTFSSFFSIILQNICDKLDQTLFSHVILNHLSPEHHSPAFILSLKPKYQTLWNQCLSNHVNWTPFLHLSSLTVSLTCFLLSQTWCNPLWLTGLKAPIN